MRKKRDPMRRERRSLAWKQESYQQVGGSLVFGVVVQIDQERIQLWFGRRLKRCCTSRWLPRRTGFAGGTANGICR